jgi:glycosyltransferase involved in cell wall biosynthesis
MNTRAIFLVIPAYNEEQRVGETVESLAAHRGRIIVVDDGSLDQTAEVARRAGAIVLRHAINRGQGAALQTGIDFALRRGAEVIVTFDADGQHDPADVEKVAAPVLAGEVDVVLGSRFLGRTEGIPLGRRLLLKAAIVFTRLVSWIAVTDAHNGLRALSRRAAQAIRITQDRMAHASEILDEIRRHRLRFREVPVTVRYTAETLRKGQSNWEALRIAGQILMGRLLR